MATMGFAPLQGLMKEDFKNIGKKNNEVRPFHMAGKVSLQFSSKEKGLVDSVNNEQCPIEGQKSLHHHINPDANSANTV